MNKVYALFLVPCVCLGFGYTYLNRGLKRREELMNFLEAHKNDVSEHQMRPAGTEEWMDDVATAAGCFICAFLVTLFLVIKMIILDTNDAVTRESVEARLRSPNARAKLARSAAREMQLVYQRHPTLDEGERF